MTIKKRVLFICTHNAARSPMAEGFLRSLYGDRYDAFSAGTDPSRVDPCAIKVMQEVGIDISALRSKSLDEFEGQEFDYVVTLCADAQEACPIFIGGEIHLHYALTDPMHSRSTAPETETDECSQFRMVRDQLKTWIHITFGNA